MVILEIKDLSLEVENGRILNELNMEIETGQICALVGPNGAGKSSFAFAVMGLEGYRNVEGDIVYKGESLNGLDVSERSERGITLAWQEPARYEGLNVGKFIRAASGRESKESPSDVLEMVGMDPDSYLDRALDSGLSGGERKKIELASILAMDPELVLLDEPDSGIDVASLDRIFEAIKLLKSRGTTVILITHSATVLEKAEHAFLMCCGSVIDEGSVDEIKSYLEEKCLPCDHKNAPELNGGPE